MSSSAWNISILEENKNPFDCFMTCAFSNKGSNAAEPEAMDETPEVTTVKVSPSEHYTQVSTNYDSVYTEINNAEMKIVEENLHLLPTDIVLDLGGGTGFMAQEIYNKGQLVSPVWCVDPSAAMIEKAKQRKGVETTVSTGEEFFSAKSIKFDKVLMVGVVHHFFDPQAVYKGVYEALQPNGFCLIILRLSPTILPFFRAAAEAFNESCKEYQALVNELSTAGFGSISYHEETTELHVTKRRWYEMVRRRFFSNLNPFSDEEIEEGIQELENEHFKETGLDDPIILYDRQSVVKATKYS